MTGLPGSSILNSDFDCDDAFDAAGLGVSGDAVLALDTGRNGAAMFAGTGGLTLEELTLADPLTALTIAVRVRLDAPAVSDAGIFYSGAATGSDDALGLRFDASGWLSGGATRDLFKASIRTSEGQTAFESSAGAARPGAWIDLALTWQSGEAPALWIDGVRDLPSAPPAALGGTISAEEIRGLVFGEGGKGEALNGALDHVAIFDTVLADAEIAAIAETGLAETGLDTGEDAANDTGSDGTPGFLTEFYALDFSPTAMAQIDFTTTPDVTEVRDRLDFDWSFGRFWAGGPKNFFAARFTGDLAVETGGTYTFQLTADDGAQLFIDGERVLNDVSLKLTTETVEVALTPGIHEIEVLYFERQRKAGLELDWAGPDTGGALVKLDAAAVSHGTTETGDPGPCPVTGGPICHCSKDDTPEDTPDDTPGDTPADGGDGDPQPGANSPPVALDDAVDAVPTMGMLHVPVADLLANDSDPDGDTLSLVALDGAVWHGDEIMVEDADGDGVATFSYTVSDGQATATAEVRVTVPNSGDDVEAFVQAVLSAPEHGGGHHHGTDPLKAAEHDKLLDLVPRAASSHIAVADGDWSDPFTWYQGRMPEDGAKVLIPETISVTVDGESAARLSTLRIDGALSFATDTDTRLVLETLVLTPGGRLEIGTEAAPIAADATAEIVIISDTPGALPEATMARGIVTHGTVSIVGADKLDHTVLAGDAKAGDTTLTLAETPSGWQIGDRIVLAGTSYDSDGSDADNSRFRDEVLEITAIEGRTVSFVNADTGGSALRFDHTIPEGYGDRFEIPVGNITRNVVVASEGGKDTPVPDRGHVMFMHSNDVVVKHAGFVGLGRADKNLLVDDPGTNVDGSLGLDGTEEGTNPRGRYSVHFHRTGTDPAQGPAIAEGLAVEGSPGWGIVHHDSHLDLSDSVVFDVLGSGIVAEAGNEIGRWANNLTIKTTGDDRDQPDFDGSARVPVFDFGFNGEGYWIQGAPLVEFVDNKAASANGAALEIFTDVDGNRNKDVNGATVAVATLAPEQRDAFLAAGYALEDKIDIRAAISPGISGFEAINSKKGIEFWNHMRNDDGVLSFFGGDGHDLRTEVSDFELWNIWGEGIFTQYSTQVDFVNGVIVGNPDDPVAFRPGINGGGLGRGIGSNGPAHDLEYRNLEIDGFEVGLRLPQEAGGFGGPSVPYFDFNGTEVYDLTVANVDSVFGNTQATWADPEAFPNFIDLSGLSLGEGVPTGELPTAAFDVEGLGGPGAVRFDASASSDADPNPAIRVADNAIAAYVWDFDIDGTPDAVGRWVTHSFGAPGSYEVALTVWDSDGQSGTTTETVEVTARAYDNLLQDGGFDAPLGDSPWYAINPSILNQGWKTTGWSVADGAAAAPLTRPINNGLQQVLLDNGGRQGLQEFRFDLDYSYFSDTEGRYLDVAVWGFDTEFKHNAGHDRLAGEAAIPMDGELLYFERFGDTDGWESQSALLDFKDGYKFVTVSFQFEGRFGDADAVRPGDAIRIDNVAIDDQGLVPQILPAEFVDEPAIL